MSDFVVRKSLYCVFTFTADRDEEFFTEKSFHGENLINGEASDAAGHAAPHCTSSNSQRTVGLPVYAH